MVCGLTLRVECSTLMTDWCGKILLNKLIWVSIRLQLRELWGEGEGILHQNMR